MENPTSQLGILTFLGNRTSNGSFQPPGDNFYQIAPIGEFPHASGVMQVIDRDATRSMANRFNRERAEGSIGLIVDFEHASHGPGDTVAAGWIEDLADRPAGLYANIRWSATGLDKIQGGEYRFISPTWLREDCLDLGNNRLRPLRLNDAGLTNRPALPGLQPLTHHATEISSLSPSLHQGLCRLFEMPANSPCSDVVAAVQTLRNRVDLVAEVREMKAEIDLAMYAGPMKPGERSAWRRSLIANRDAFLPLLKATAEPLPLAFPLAVRMEILRNKSPGQAIGAAISEHPALHRAWLAAGGGSLDGVLVRPSHPLLNRLGEVTGHLEHADAVRLAREREPKVSGYLRQYIEMRDTARNAIPQTYGPDEILARVVEMLKSRMQATGVTFDVAWDWLKKNQERWWLSASINWTGDLDVPRYVDSVNDSARSDSRPQRFS